MAIGQTPSNGPNTVVPEIRTSRLLMRAWDASDLGPFAALNADPRVMEHFPSTLDLDQTRAFIERIESHFHQHGFGLWALQRQVDGVFLGYTGLKTTPFASHFTPAVEVGWRLGAEHWGNGFATEAATAALDFGFEQVGVEEVVSFTVPGNLRSTAVMERLGMTRDPSDDFDNPLLPMDSPLRRHVLYRLTSDRWRARGGGTGRSTIET